MKKNIVLGIDLDNVCADYTDGLRQYVAPLLGVRPENIPDPIKYSFYESGWGFSSEDHFRQLHGLAVEDGIYSELELIEGTTECLWALSDLGYHIDIITSRFVNNGQHRKVVSQTVDWLDRKNVPFRDLSFLGDKNRHIVDVMLDDSPSNIERLRSIGREVVVFDQLYNQMLDGPRVYSWEDFYEYVTVNYPLN